MRICCLQNGSTALHAAVMSGKLQTVLLLLGANADPSQPNKVTQKRTELHNMSRELWFVNFFLCVSQNNELPSHLTKNDRILKVLRPTLDKDS